MTTKTITPEKNPSNGRIEFALRLDGVHCGYAGSYLDADKLADEIAAKREAAQTAAYLAPRKQPRKARVKKCDCPQCQPATYITPNGIYSCLAGRKTEWLAYHAGLYIAAKSTYLDALDALNRYRYESLRHGHGLDAEQAGDVLVALATTTN